eukprot:1230912-Prorocentrum_lima.AAC.1
MALLLSYRLRKERLVGQLLIAPIEEELDVERRRDLHGLHHGDPIGPQVRVVAGAHHGAAAHGAAVLDDH